MRATFTMWKNRRMVLLTAVCAVIYGGARSVLTIDFPLLAPEVMGMGAANLLPMLLGLLFGPAGAWGAAIGHLISDVGALTWRTLFEAVGVFLLGYLPYAMWTTLQPIADGRREPSARNWRSWVLYVLLALMSSVAGTLAIVMLLETLGFIPYSVSLVVLFFVAAFSLVGNLMGGVIFFALYGVIKKRLGLIWWDVMDAREIGQPIAGVSGAWLAMVGTLIGTAGTAVSFGGSPAGSIIGIVGLILIFIGGALM